MAASVRSAATAVVDAASPTLLVPLPAGWVAGDVCYIGLTVATTTPTITTPAGWTAVVASFSSSANANTATQVFRRVLVGGDTDVTVTTTSGKKTAVSVAVQGADTVTPEDVAGASDVNSGIVFPNVQAPSVTTVNAGALLLTFHAVRHTNNATMSFTPPSGMTDAAQIGNAAAAGSLCGIEAAYLALGAAGATGLKTATVAFAAGTVSAPMGATVAVRSAAGAAVGLPDLVMARYGR